uniref:Uncharacterized protein n=1 Tax=Oncorhynchus mykiss TaxID=8022 RepID=A0A8C7LML0_ONCMY
CWWASWRAFFSLVSLATLSSIDYTTTEIPLFCVLIFTALTKRLELHFCFELMILWIIVWLDCLQDLVFSGVLLLLHFGQDFI